jgi:hypothetical protein
MNETLVVISLVMVGIAAVVHIVTVIGANITAPPAEYVLKTPHTTDTWTSSCGCGCDDDDANDIALIKCFQDVARDKELPPEINEKARIALLNILEDYVPEEDGATVVTAPEEKA